MNDVVFETLFRQAVIDDFNEEIDSIPSEEELTQIYSLSSRFEIGIKKLLAKDRKKDFLKKFINAGRKTASIFLIGLGLLYGILLLNSEVRATTEDVLVGWYKQFTSFTIRDDEFIDRDKDWILNYLPQGYVLENLWVRGWTTYMEFTNTQRDKIRFSYTPGEEGTDVLVDEELDRVYTSKVLGKEAFFVKSTDEELDNGLIWNKQGYNFDLWGKFSMEELIKIAESLSVDK